MKDVKLYIKVFLITLLTIGICTFGLSKVLPDSFAQSNEDVLENKEDYYEVMFTQVNKVNKKHSDLFNGFKKEEIDGEDYYVITNEYEGEYFLSYSSNSPMTQAKIMTYEEYSKFCKEWNLFQKYLDESKEYIVYSYNTNSCATVSAEFAGMRLSRSKTILYIWDKARGCITDGGGYYLVIPVDKGIKEVDITPVYKEEELRKIENNGILNVTLEPNDLFIAKPVIYLYPEETTEVNVKLDLEGELLFTYPKYEKEWNVIAESDGTLTDKETGKEYSYLFWEGDSDVDWDFSEGYVVKGEDTVEFLQSILSKMGLIPKEYNEFIVYWASLMEGNEYNLISFQEEIYEETAELIITPKPDSILRVFMAYKALENPIKIKAPTIKPFERNGFTVVEWGGTEVK